MAEATVKRSRGATDGPILPVELDPHHCRFLLSYITLETRQERDEDDHFEG